VRRVEAITGDNALAYMQGMETALGGVAGTLKVQPAMCRRVVYSGILDQVRQLERELARLKSKLAAGAGRRPAQPGGRCEGRQGAGGATLEGADVNALRETMDKLKDKLKSAAVVLASVAAAR
jgi:alanyl-tRNA synthetase